MTKGSQQSFSSLFNEIEGIEIPIIQRDYAQGRPQEIEVRTAFLESLKTALVADDSGYGLDLDFVYGSIMHGEGELLSVLDGQQRLTTLFLLHWYLAARDGRLDHFKDRFTKAGRSRFSYATRPSSSEFFHALACADFDLPEPSTRLQTISAMIVDCNWFFLAWRGDPTVQSCLAMLDTIDDMFGAHNGLYERLVDEHSKCITFHFLDLHDFGLSDDLYIKMNARGKALTPFENFKAWLVDHIGGAVEGQQFDLNMDQKWMDFFWRLSRENHAELKGLDFDDLFLRFLYLMAFFEACGNIKGPYWLSDVALREWAGELRTARGHVPLRQFERYDSFGPDMVRTMSKALDFFLDDANDADKHTLIRNLSAQPDQGDLIRLFAIVAPLEDDTLDGLDTTARAVRVQRWKRVTSNLINNARIEEMSAIATAVSGLRLLWSNASDLYGYLANDTPGGVGFNSVQVAEECRKAALIGEDATWEAILADAEAHTYLQGRVGFLIDFAQQAEGGDIQAAFMAYSVKAAGVLSGDILKSGEFLLQRALLSIDDYLVARGSSKYSFCVPNATSFRDRSENWLRVVETKAFKQLLDSVDSADVEGSLRALITSASCADWRKYLVANPELIGYCKERRVHKGGAGKVYLLSKSNLRGYFVELRSYALYLDMLEQQRKNDLTGIDQLWYRAVYGEANPELELEAGGRYTLRFEDGNWHCFAKDEVVDMPRVVEQHILDRGLTV